jgi:hypothetical protein
VWGQRLEGAVEVVDAVTQFVPQPLGQAVPVCRPGDVAFGQLGRGGSDLGDGQAHPPAGADHGDAAQRVAVVAALVAGGAVAGKLGTEVLWSDLVGGGARLGVIGRSGPWRR